jgi:hypothetical protein
MIFILVTMNIGCTGSNPIIPGIIDPNPTVNPDNSTVSYVIVSAASSSAKVGESVQIVVKGYNSDDEWIVLDKSKIKSWGWNVQGQCYNCIKPFVNLSPKSGSLTTTFSSGKSGTFFIVAYAYYLENTGDDYITDYTEVKVTN